MSDELYIKITGTYTSPILTSNKKIIEVKTLKNDLTPEAYTMYNIYNAVSKMRDIYPNVESSLILAIIQKESRYNPAAYGAGAVGLMQIIPACHTDRIARLGIEDIWDPYSNVLVGTDLISELVSKYQDPGLALMCYNMGEGTALYKYNNHGYSDYALEVLRIKEEIERSNDYGTNSRQEDASSNSGNS